MVRPVFGEKGFTHLREGDFLVQLGGDLQFTDSQAAGIPGASFSKKFTNSYVLNASVGAQVLGPFYFGLRYGYWLASQNYNVSGVSSSDTLTIHGFGPEVGALWGNPRIQYRAVLGFSYPVGLKIDRQQASSQTFSRDTLPLTYELRLQLNLKFNSHVSWLVEGGYRRVNLGKLLSGSTDYITSGASLDLSGLFVGTGMGIHF
jgi:hypothetical protein